MLDYEKDLIVTPQYKVYSHVGFYQKSDMFNYEYRQAWRDGILLLIWQRYSGIVNAVFY